jgi:hypothetical protein
MNVAAGIYYINNGYRRMDGVFWMRDCGKFGTDVL